MPCNAAVAAWKSYERETVLSSGLFAEEDAEDCEVWKVWGDSLWGKGSTEMMKTFACG